jgi:DNA-binding CsgD family transcriptional regulator
VDGISCSGGPFILMADTPIKRAQTYEALLADISSQFANLPSDQFEREIEDALRQLIAFLGFDRGFFAEFDDEGWLNVSCAVSVEGMEAWSRGPMPAFLSWYVGQLGAGNIISIESIDDFPPEATGEVEDFRRTEMHSQLAISLRVDGRIIAAIGFDALHPTQAWPDHLTAPLRLLGEVFALALARKRAEDNLAAALAEIEQLRHEAALAEIEQLQREDASLPSEQSLCSRFGLTAAEAHIALGIARGETLALMASARGTSVTTARTQLQSVFAKVGVRRQAELVALLSGRLHSSPESAVIAFRQTTLAD